MASNHELYKRPNVTVLEHLMNKNDDNIIKVVMNWILRKKTPRVRSIKSQLHIVENYLERLDIHE